MAEAKKAASDLFDKLDTNKGGTISLKELKGRLCSADFSAAHPDKDKTLTKEEYLAVSSATTDLERSVNA